MSVQRLLFGWCGGSARSGVLAFRAGVRMRYAGIDWRRPPVVVVVVFILIRKPNGQICPMKRWRMQIESSNK